MQIFRPDFLPWNTTNANWIVIESANVSDAFVVDYGMKQVNGTIYVLKCSENWIASWQAMETDMAMIAASGDLKCAVISKAELPPIDELKHELRPLNYLSTIAQNAWLVDALLDDRIVCFLQQMQDSHGKVFGYEAFARALNEDGSQMSGAEIIKASREIKIEYRIDRFLHSKAIEAMVRGGYGGTLFVNFLPGFIQKPDVYLDGLSREVQRHGLVPQRIALDLTEAELPRNRKQIAAIGEYCKKQGYHIALDNISSSDEAARLIELLNPSFLKLGHKITDDVKSPHALNVVKSIVDVAHKHGVTVIASRIETENKLTILKGLNIDLFQGYHVGRPEQALAPSSAA